jgi:tetratricopeptide (TPR) repeat protein
MHRFLAPALLVALVALAAPALAQPATATDSLADSVATTVDSTAAPAISAAEAARQDSLEQIRAMRARARASYEEGSNLLQAEDFAGALIRFEDGIAIDSNSVGNTYGRAFALAQLDRESEAIEGFLRAGRLADAVGDTATARLARTSREGIVARRASAVAPVYGQVDELMAAIPPTRESGEQAVALMESIDEAALEDLAYHYRWARALNAAERFADAAEHAEHAIRMSTDEADRSAYYYEFGVALKGMGQATPARDAFERARTGAWAAWAEYQITAMGTAAGN